MVLYELLTGEKPAGAEVPSDVNPRSPRALDEIFRRSYARLDKRYATAEEFLAALNSASAAAVSASPPPLPSLSAHRVAARGDAAAAGDRARRGPVQCPRATRPRKSAISSACNAGPSSSKMSADAPSAGDTPDRTDAFCMFCGQPLAAVTPSSGGTVQGG